MFKGILQFFKRKKSPSPESSEEFLKNKYQSFKRLLDANNEALELMSKMETVASGDFVFDMQYIKTKTAAIIGLCKVILEELNNLSDNRYTGVWPVFDQIKVRLERELAWEPPPVPKGALVLSLAQVDRRLREMVGGKNATLGEIRNRLGLPTPDGFVLTCEAGRLIFRENRLAEKLADFLAQVPSGGLPELKGKSQRFREEILKAEIPPVLQEEVARHWDRLAKALNGPLRLALRSSNIREDQEFSFAGQFLSRLNVSREHFFSAYLEVLASQWSPEALVYAREHGWSAELPVMSVGCLVMVPARASGVLFTAEPAGGREGVMVVEAAWGLGPTVVQGLEVPDRYLLSKNDPMEILEQQISVKRRRLRPAPEGEGLISEEVPRSERTKPALTRKELWEVAHYGRELEDYFGEPQNIEFAVDEKGKVFILQSRPLQVSRPLREEAGKPVAVTSPILLEGGTPACFGVASGPVFIVRKDEDLARFPEGAVLVTRHTLSRYGAVLHKAAALLADIGSATSHLAILAREYKVPALVDTEVATRVLHDGQVITVDADHQRVYAGLVPELLRESPRPVSPLAKTPLYGTLRRVLRLISPLNLKDPRLTEFKPEFCRTLHDLTRFAHQMAIAEMFDLGEKVSREEPHLVHLDTTLPLNLYLLDLGGGLRPGIEGGQATPEDILSIPLRALWRGISHPEVSWAGPISLSTRGLLSVVSRSVASAGAASGEFWLRTLAIISRNYLNYSSRLGYHIATIDAYVSEVRNDNYISFRFKGGAADEYRRGLRARFLGAVLEKLDFITEVSSDLVVAKLSRYPQALMEEKLDLLGRLLACARQRDMVMDTEEVVERSIQAFLEGNYRFFVEAH